MEQNEIDSIYTEIKKLPIELEPDPTVLGAPYIIEVVSRCRNHLNRVSMILLDLSQSRRATKLRLAGEETILAAEKDRLLAEDEVVRRAANIRDREAIANTKLRDRLNEIHALKSELLDLETVEKAVKLIHDELVRTSNEIKTQRAMIFSDRTSGAGYGDEAAPRDHKGRVLPPRDEDIDFGELDGLVAEVSRAAPENSPETASELVVEASDEVSPEPETAVSAAEEVTSDEKALSAFLEGDESSEVTDSLPPAESVTEDEESEKFTDEDDFLNDVLKSI